MHEQGLTQRPLSVVSDRDAATASMLADELHARHDHHCDVLVAASNEEAGAHLREVAQRDVALVVADRADDGVALLAATRTLRDAAAGRQSTPPARRPSASSYELALRVA